MDGTFRNQNTQEQGDDGSALEANVLLWAVGRRPDIKTLNLDTVVIQTNEFNIVVDEWQQRTVLNIFAIGDVQGKWLLTPVAIAAGRRLADHLFGPEKFKNDKLVYENIPSVVFSHPSIGAVGLTEPEIGEQFGDAKIKIYKTSFRAFYFSMPEEQDKEPSVYKSICAGEDERIVGLHIISLGSDEVTQGFAAAIRMGATKKDFDDTISIHPTWAEELITLR
ncbi:GLR1_2 [Sanghuangporus vaninii]